MLRETIKDVKRTVKNWWVYLILGILYIAGGILLACYPGATYIALTVFISVWILISGLFSVIFAVSNRALSGWGWYLAGGILELFLGLLLVCYPQIMAAVLPFVVGFWLMFRGISIIATSMDLSTWKIPNWGWVLAFGILVVILSFLAIIFPVATGAGISFFVAASVIALGIGTLLFAFKLKSIKSDVDGVVERIEKRLEE